MRSYSVDKPIIKAHAVKYFTNPRPASTLHKTELSLALHHHTCLPCQREVDWRQGTNCCFVEFYLRYVRLFLFTKLFLPSRRRDCHTTIPRSAPTLHKTALSHSLFVGRGTACAYTGLHLNYPIHFS